MKVIVYCEGRSDRLAMTALFQSLIERKQQAGIAIDFTAIERGDGKKSVLLEVPRRAASILLNQWQDTYVIALPDLYPRNKAFPHESAQELIDGILQRFMDEIERKDHKIDKRLLQRFKAFCFKYELEALLLHKTYANVSLCCSCFIWGQPPRRSTLDLHPIHRQFNVSSKPVPETARFS